MTGFQIGQQPFQAPPVGFAFGAEALGFEGEFPAHSLILCLWAR
jgi:hypothetical protein